MSHEHQALLEEQEIQENYVLSILHYSHNVNYRTKHTIECYAGERYTEIRSTYCRETVLCGSREKQIVGWRQISHACQPEKSLQNSLTLMLGRQREREKKFQSRP